MNAASLSPEAPNDGATPGNAAFPGDPDAALEGAILYHMERYQREHGMPPTLRDLARACGDCSTTRIVSHLTRLARAGLVVHDDGLGDRASRCWRLAGEGQS